VSFTWDCAADPDLAATALRQAEVGDKDEPSFDQEKAMGEERAGKLLLVEDEHVLRGLIAQFLRAEGYDVVEAADGSEGVEFFASRRPFDLVLLDLNLPILSGVDVCRSIKSQEPTQAVIICSAAILDSHISALLAMNVEHFLSKPYHPLDLLDMIAARLSRTNGSELPERASSSRTRVWKSCPSHSGATSLHTLVKSPILD
jgi:DNA-binding response OmpR family regulator